MTGSLPVFLTMTQAFRSWSPGELTTSLQRKPLTSSDHSAEPMVAEVMGAFPDPIIRLIVS
jgi:hypothetical protein